MTSFYDNVDRHSLKDSSTKFDNGNDYDPYLHREIARPTTNLETLIHLFKCSCGTGIVAMPKAFSYSGYVVGIVGTLIIGFLATYCVHLIIRCEYELCKRKKVPSLTYPGIAEAGFAEGPRVMKMCSPYAGHIINIFLFIYQMGGCCVYNVFIASNVQAVVNEYTEGFRIELYMLMFLVPTIFLNWIRDLKRLAPLSTVANFTTLVSLAITMYYIIKEGPTVEGRDPVGTIQNFPLFFGTVIFALEAIGVIIPLENEMKDPKAFGGIFGVLNRGMVAVVLLYGSLGLLGYLSYGPLIEASVTLNLPKGKIVAQVVKASLALSVLITYTIQYYVAIDIAWNHYLGPKLDKHPWATLIEYSLRTVLVLLTFALAAAVPALDLFISFFGALCLSVVGIAIPAAIECGTFWYHKRGWQFYWMISKNVALALFGICGLISGTYISLRDIIHRFG
ncbi:hypothetical protein RI129_010793 [Pyrocoelia pectoralis]|uniref:Amino acid transporter transmembrane domain-containing protein n=1 Tax=Pyrocoelia pectoralis TaxID=417401 RepID=A0AAN7ZES1_9COLE